MTTRRRAELLITIPWGGFLEFRWRFHAVSITITLATLFSNAAQGASHEGESVRQSLAAEAMAYDYRRNKDHGRLMEQVLLVKLHAKGVSQKDIVAQVLTKRREWARLQRTVMTGDWRVERVYGTLTRAVGRIATQIGGGGSTGVEAADLIVQGYEAVIRGEKVSRAVERMAEEVRPWTGGDSVRGFYGLVHENYRSDRKFRNIWDTLYSPTYGYLPDDPRDEISKQAPDFFESRSIRQILDNSNDRTVLLGEVKNNQDKIFNEIIEFRKQINGKKSIAAIVTIGTRERWAREDAENERLRQARIDEIEMEGIRSAIGLAATFIGVSEPNLGRQIIATGNVMFAVRDGLKEFIASQDDANVNLAAVALTGDVVGATLSLMDTFVDTGPTSEEVILEQLGELREAVENVRREMHERFDGIHRHLDIVYKDMLNGFDLLREGQESQEEMLREVILDLEGNQLRLNDIGNVQIDTQSIVVQQGEVLSQLIIDLALANCTRRNRDSTIGDPMYFDEFRKCRATIEAVSRHLPGLQLEANRRSEETLDNLLSARPDRTISSNLEAFRQLLTAASGESRERAAELPDLFGAVVGPEAWFYAADIHDEFLTLYLRCAKFDTEDIAGSEFRSDMRRYRSVLRQYAEAIRKDFEAFQNGSDQTALSMLLKTAWNGVELEKLANGRVRADLLEMPQFRQHELKLSIAGARLRAWIALALYDAIGRSELVTELVSGSRGFPNIRSVFEQSGGDVYAAWAVDEVSRRIDVFRNTLRSTKMQDAIRYGFGHRILFGTHFDYLDNERFQGAQNGIQGTPFGHDPNAPPMSCGR